MIGLQRARLLGAAVGVLAEQGYAGFTASAVCGRAGVSRRTFYEVFENREQCFVAILADAQLRAGSVIAALELEGLGWSERVRLGLWVLLCLIDEDAALARACLVESQRAGGAVQRQRELIIARLVDAIDQGRARRAAESAAGATSSSVSGAVTSAAGAATAAATSRLTAEALVGAVISVIASRLPQATAARNGRSRGDVGVRGLLGELMGMIVLPYQGPAAARRQLERSLPEVPVIVLGGLASAPDPLASLPMRLTYRTARVLLAVAQLTRVETGASNRQIAEQAGIADAGQTSKLLGRLAQYGLLENTAVGSRERGEANRWRLTDTGVQVVQSIGTDTQTYRRESRRGARRGQVRQRGERIA